MNTGTCFLLALLCVIEDIEAGYGSYSSNGPSSASAPKKYTITTLVAPPFIDAPDEDGNLSGLFVDILNAFKAAGDFDYDLSLSETELYGDSFPNGTSNGMISDVVTGSNTLNPVVKKIWASIQKDPANNIVTSYEDGVQRVANGGNVAFVADTPFVTLEQQKHKDKVFFTGDNLSYVWFAMAVKIDSPLRRILNDKILELTENGGYDSIYQKLPSLCLS